ncbi:MAG: sugar ABC transporter ATP-binding protein [Coriobacteriia bacterium]|nr:sugar ABC transporter ATP-binding protein [Coriobacteriia bacterium]
MLEIKNISKSFGATIALKDVSFNIESGKIHALIGENGSGKSTLTNILTGIVSADSGEFILDGKKLNHSSLVEANNAGVSIVIQELGTIDNLTVAENIFLGHENKFIKCGIKNVSYMNKEANKLLKDHGLEHIKASCMINEYNFEERKFVEIIKALYFMPKILVIDETTTALSKEGRDALYSEMKKFKASGGSIIFISHDLEEVLSLSDYATVLRDGTYIDTVKIKDVTEKDLRNLMVGREFSGALYRQDYDEKVSDEVVLSVKNALNDVSFDLHKGEILGVGGLSDSGMHELGKVIFGASFKSSGDVCLADGTKIGSIPKAIKNDIAYTSKDRDNESVILFQSIYENIALPSLSKIGRFFTSKKLKFFANKYAKQISVKMHDSKQFVSELSGGNKQKVVLAKWIGRDSNILILDSPTRGIDIKVKQDIYKLMDTMRKSGKSIIMISEELNELIGMSDRIIIMKDNRLNAVIKRKPDLSENELIEKMI